MCSKNAKNVPTFPKLFVNKKKWKLKNYSISQKTVTVHVL